AAVASINGGKLLQPHIVSKVVDNNGNTVQEMGTEIRRQVISKETSQIMQSALEQVVSANGGTNAYVKGYKIGGKSGTAQKLTDKTDTKRVFSYFVFAPADDPKVAALVMMDEPTEGKRDFANVVVGPLASAVMKDILPYMGIAPQYSEDELENQDLTIPSGMLGGDPFSAESKLRKKGLNGKIIGNGKTVTAIYPAQGTKIPREGTVVIYTEKDASQTVKVPNVVGVTPTQANQVLTNAGLNIKISGGAANNQRARTSAQSIEVGKEVPRGSIVEVQCLIAGEDGE
ncbi:MAG: penicillin-binding transpeptidase domain-containing protein, partial [Oscillospiraceae bacterium]